MDEKVRSIMIEKVTEWKRFARLTCCSGNLDAIVNQLDHDVVGEKSKLECFLTKLVEFHPNDYITYIQKSLKTMGRNDLLQDLASLSIEKKKSETCEALKKFYLQTYGKMDQIVHNVKNPPRVELLNKFIELTVFDADEVEKDTVNILEQKLFLQKQMTYQPIEFNEVFSKELSLLLISGIAGIGKTWLLRKCLLDWANGTLWKKVDIVLHFECRKLNQYQNISNISELLRIFYKDIFKEFDVCDDPSVLFVIDGLDEFAHLDELINHNFLNPSKQPIVNTLAEILNIQKHKCVVAGRVGAISQYKDKVTECTDKLVIQIMGLNDKGIDEYIEKFGNKIETIKNVLKESCNAKAMASVPFYLSAICTIIALTDSYSFYTMTELYCCIFLYFFQKHVCKSNEAVYKMMQSEGNKLHVLRVCKVAWELFNQGKFIFSQDEMKGIVNDFDKVENELLGFIERIESQLGYQYQFAHLTLMEFCASVHAYNNLSPEEIICSKKLHSCWPMICGLANANEKCFVRFLAKLKNSNEKRNSLVYAVCDLIDAKTPSDDDRKMFMECFFEAQASLTEDLKRSIDKQYWWINIDNIKTAHEALHERYFMENFIDAGFKLNYLRVVKNILSEDEKKLVILCSTNVRRVYLFHPVKIDGWIPKHKVKEVVIVISHTFVSKNMFKGSVLPWIRLAEELTLDLHNDTNFIDDICEWLRGSSCKWLTITYRGKDFHNIEELKNLK